VRKKGLIPLVLVGLALVLLPLQAVVELPGEKSLKEALGFDYPKSCADYTTIGKGQFGAWRAEPNLSALRDEPRVAALGNTVYLAGGLVARGQDTVAIDRFESYDVRLRRYKRLPPLPRALNHIGIVAYDGRIYVVGGYEGGVNDPVSTDRAWRYEPRSRSWHPIAPLPSPRGAHGLVVVGRKMYAIGGRLERGGRPGSSLDRVDAYDFVSDEWSERAALPHARDHAGVAVYKGKIYVVGGRPGRANAYRFFERYDPAADRWERLADYPLPVSGTGLAAVGRRLVAAGGEDPGRGRLIGRAYAYDPRSGDWEALPSMPRPKHGFGALALEGRFWAFGGAECYGFHPSRSVDSLDPDGGA
jgi:N-acetylneuraminic acid mutarotase